jgi:drug/metabolite transporter superfamily protein YnfA
MEVVKSIGLFALAGLCEIGGGLICLMGVAVILYAPRQA